MAIFFLVMLFVGIIAFGILKKNETIDIVKVSEYLMGGFFGIWIIFSISESWKFLRVINRERTGRKSEELKKYYKAFNRVFPKKKLKYYQNKEAGVFFIVIVVSIISGLIKPFGIEISSLSYYSIIGLELAIIINSVFSISANSLSYGEGLICLGFLVASYIPYVYYGVDILLPPLIWYIIVSIVGRNLGSLDSFDRSYLKETYPYRGGSGLDCCEELPPRFKNYYNVGDGWIDGAGLDGSNPFFIYMILTGIWAWLYIKYLI